MRKRHASGAWAVLLSAAQRETVKQLRLEYSGAGKSHHGTDGWTVYMMPSTMPATYLELRHYLTEGTVARWVIEKDGTVSVDNDRGQRRELQAVA